LQKILKETPHMALMHRKLRHLKCLISLAKLKFFPKTEVLLTFFLAATIDYLG
jgi:hypothetical protein